MPKFLAIGEGAKIKAKIIEGGQFDPPPFPQGFFNNNHFLFPFFLLISYMYFTINKRRKGYWRPVITIGLKVPDRQLHSHLAKYGR